MPSTAEKERQSDFVELLRNSGAVAKFHKLKKNEVVFNQGSRGDTVFYLNRGLVKLGVVSRLGKEAIVAILGPDSFFGEKCLAGGGPRLETATTLSDCSVVAFWNKQMLNSLRKNPELAEQFIAYLIQRNSQLEADLIDKLVNPSERRLARLLLLLAPLETNERTGENAPSVSQDMIAHMIGMTRTRVSFFMNKFRRLGFIDYNKKGLRVHPSLRTWSRSIDEKLDVKG